MKGKIFMNKSIWVESVINNKEEYSKLDESIETDIVIIGGGLTGLTSAYYLAKEGKDLIILEKNKICNHTSGNTTAKITSQHGLFYNYLINSIGEKQAKQYLAANEKAIKNIKKIIDEENIDCDFEEQDAYVFTQKEEDLNEIKKEVKAVNSIGFKSEFIEKIELPLDNVLGAIKFKGQAQFNPYKYSTGLANSIEKYGGKIYEDSKVIDIKKSGEKYTVKTEGGEVVANKVILASHYPIITFPGYYFMKMYQETSYLIAVETSEELFNGMYISSEEPTISFRTAIFNGKKVLLVGGMKHKTGAKIDLKDAYNELEKVAKTIYPDAKVIYSWNTEDCISLDKIPYIGEFSNLMPNVYVATGYKKWGMTTSNLAANIITDKILGKENQYEEVFKSTRLKPIKNYEELGNMVKEVSYSLIFNKLKTENNTINSINPEDGKIVEIDKSKVGIYKDKNGNIYAVKPYCTHLGCELSWNNLDKTWDCPCHGSRFNYDGKSIYDPSIKDLETFNIENP